VGDVTETFPEAFQEGRGKTGKKRGRKGRTNDIRVGGKYLTGEKGRRK